MGASTPSSQPRKQRGAAIAWATAHVVKCRGCAGTAAGWCLVISPLAPAVYLKRVNDLFGASSFKFYFKQTERIQR